MLHITDDCVRVSDHVLICPDNGKLSRDRLHALGIKGAIEAGRNFYGTFGWVIGNEKTQTNIAVTMFDNLYSIGSHAVEVSISTYDKVSDAKLRIVVFHCCFDLMTEILWSIPMAKKKASCHFLFTLS